MTAAAMARQIVAYVTANPHSSFFQLVEHLGEPAKGDRVIEIRPNLCLWIDVSNLFIDALNSVLNKEVKLEPANRLTYLVDGCLLPLPIPRRAQSSYAKPYWAPATLSINEVYRTAGGAQ